MCKIRTAVVGMNMGLEHAYAYKHAELSELCWVVDWDENKAAKMMWKRSAYVRLLNVDYRFFSAKPARSTI